MSLLIIADFVQDDDSKQKIANLNEIQEYNNIV